MNFYQNKPKIKLFLPTKYKFFERWGLCTRPPSQPPLQISDYAPALRCLQFTKKHTGTCQGPKRSSESTVNKVLALFQKNSMQY